MTITIKDTEVKLRYSFRCYFIFENIMGRSFSPNTTTDVLVFFYSTIMASNKDLDFNFEEFLDMVDDNPQLIVDFGKFITDELTKSKALAPEHDDEKKTVKEEKK